MEKEVLVEKSFEELMQEVIDVAIKYGDDGIVRFTNDIHTIPEARYDGSKEIQSEIVERKKEALERAADAYVNHPNQVQFKLVLQNALTAYASEVKRLQDFESYENAHENKQTQSEPEIGK